MVLLLVGVYMWFLCRVWLVDLCSCLVFIDCILVVIIGVVGVVVLGVVVGVGVVVFFLFEQVVSVSVRVIGSYWCVVVIVEMCDILFFFRR